MTITEKMEVAGFGAILIAGLFVVTVLSQILS
jgi:hypothetical protein